MSGTHAVDLHERVIAAWRQGKSAIARHFMFGYSTVRRYIVRFEASGSVRARPAGWRRPTQVCERPDAMDEESARVYAPRAGRTLNHATSIDAAAHGTNT
jgi:transposase